MIFNTVCGNNEKWKKSPFSVQETAYSDKNKKQALFRSGWRPYSFVFKKGEYDKNDLEFYEKLGIPISLSNDGNLYVSYKGFEPLSAIFALAVCENITELAAINAKSVFIFLII